MSVSTSHPPGLVVENRLAERLGAFGGPRATERVLIGLIVASLAIAAVSLIFPSTPSYDPWSWIIWGRQIVHGSLDLQNGPSWKPLPVIFTTVFGLFGQAAPNLWLVVARGGATLASLMTFWFAARFTWWLRDPSPGSGRRQPGAELANLAAAALAGSVAMVGLVLSSEFLSTSILGYSEGLMIAATLIAIERHIDGHPRQAFAVGMIAALDRPEFWALWGPYGLWLIWTERGSKWRDRRSTALVVGLGVLTVLLWFVPQKLGGVALTQAANHDLTPTGVSAASASCPICSELVDHAWKLMPLRVKLAELLTLLVGAVLTVRAWRARGAFKLETDHDRGIAGLLAFGLLGCLWFLIVGIETEFGFSGNTRYLVLGSALLFVCGGGGIGWAAVASGRQTRRLAPRLAAHLPPAALTLAATAGLSAVFLFVPRWVGNSLVSPAAVRQGMSYQSQLREDMVTLIRRAGGAERVSSCGPVMTEAYQVPMVAWYLRLPFTSVEEGPAINAQGLAPVPKGQWPAVIFQAAPTPSNMLEPQPTTINGWKAQGARYTVLREKTMSLYRDCRG
jgi:hypothetical protein